MKSKKLMALLLAAFMTLALCACGAPAEKPAAEKPAAEAPAEAAEVTLKDMIGRELTLKPGSYKKVVCIGAGALRMYSYIADPALLCGVEDIDNLSLKERPKMFDSVARPYVLAFGEQFKTLPSCGVGGPMAQTAEAEKILFCGPDIVFSEYEDADKENALQDQLGVPVVTLKTGPGGVFDESFAGSMRLLGKIFGKDERAEEIVGFVEKEKKEIQERTGKVKDEEKPAVYICGLGNWGTTNHLMTAQNYIGFKVANVKNVVEGLEKNGIQPIEKEKFVDLGKDMDIMIIDAAAVKNIKPLMKEDPKLLDSSKAWKEGEAYLQMAFNAYYTNYETALMNTWFIAKTVYPELFKDIDMTAKTDEICKVFLGKELSKEIFACPSSFGGYQKIDTAKFFAE